MTAHVTKLTGVHADGTTECVLSDAVAHGLRDLLFDVPRDEMTDDVWYFYRLLCMAHGEVDRDSSSHGHAYISND